MKPNRSSFAILCVALAASPAAAVDYLYTGHNGSNIQSSVRVNIKDYLPWRSGGSARALGMAGAYTAVADDLASIEYNPAGLARVKRFQASLLGVMSYNPEIGATNFGKTKEWEMTPSFAAAALKVWRLTAGFSIRQPYFPATYQSFGSVQRNVTAPDGWRMSYDRFSDRIDVKDLRTYALTGAFDLGALSVGANLNMINGKVVRRVRGRVSSREGASTNSRFDSEDTATFDGFTGDVGALCKLSVLRVGASARNVVGSVKVKQKYYWRDNFDLGGANFVYNPPSTESTLDHFAPVYTGALGLDLGKPLLLDVDFETVDVRGGSNRTLVRAGAETRLLPLVSLRAGMQSDLKNATEFGDKKASQIFLGAGLRLWALHVDGALSMAQLKQGKDGANVNGAVSAVLAF